MKLVYKVLLLLGIVSLMNLAEARSKKSAERTDKNYYVPTRRTYRFNSTMPDGCKHWRYKGEIGCRTYPREELKQKKATCLKKSSIFSAALHMATPLSPYKKA